MHKIVNGTYYHKEVPNDLVSLLEQLREDKRRIIIKYGDVVSGLMEPQHFPERGTIGRSTGSQKVPLLIKTKRSLGGEILSEQRILQICTSPEGSVLWTHPILLEKMKCRCDVSFPALSNTTSDD